MQEKYDPKKIEAKWQEKWQKSGIYKTKDLDKKPKFYALDFFPYPSGEGLHVGHTKGYTATDAVSRMKMMQGFNLLHPMGWDAFGLPAENYAIKNKIHPRISTEKNIDTFRKQLHKIGFTYDWDREVSTIDPEFYKWTQWIFLKMFEKGLAYEFDEPVNWCPSCKTVLANEDLEGGLCERCGTQVVQKKMKQWVLKMTAYADRLLNDLDKKDLDWEELIKEQQRNWIGRSEGVQFEMKIKDTNEKIEVYTTRIDTVFGMTYAVVAPEHPVIGKLKDKINNYEDKIEPYLVRAQNKTNLERMELQKEKTGERLEGVEAINPFTGESAPLFVADYVLASYGTGAVMAVPAHDERDFEFAKKYGLPIKITIIPAAVTIFPGLKNAEIAMQEERNKFLKGEKAFCDDGELVSSLNYNNLTSAKAREEMAKWLEEKKIGKKKVNFKMRDWVFSRQRYWGEPIPLIFCPECKKLVENSKFQIPNLKQIPNSNDQKIEGVFKNSTSYKLQATSYSLGEILNPGWIAVNEKDLPVRLPEVESYEPTGTGESPLANIKEWVNVKCPKCGGAGKRETNTMPQWAGSSWYYLAYIMRGISNFQFPIFKYKEKLDKWLPVDLYVGGAEHATRHLLYARFWHKFLFDLGVVSTEEPFKKLFHVGLILAEDGRKMSKRWGNVINPDDMIGEFGADSFRLYEMFMGPFSQAVSWSTKGVVGMRRFLDRVWGLQEKIHPVNSNEVGILPKAKLFNRVNKSQNPNLERLVNKTIKKVTEDIENFKFNTAISALMILSNEMEKQENIPKEQFEKFLILLSPFAPHIAEELWSELGNKKSIFLSQWPAYNESLIKEEEIEMLFQVNGKLRDKIKAAADISEDDAKALALNSEKIKKEILGKEIRKVIFVKGRLINIVLKL